MKNRQFKFRVWDIRSARFLNDFYIKPNGKIHCYFLTEKDNEEMQDNFIIQQSTGLKDKLGHEIWEGDIIKYDTRKKFKRFNIFPVEWSVCQGGGFNCLTLFHHPFGEVIGNIFENPELLK